MPEETNGKASIREVYAVASRIEEKLDKHFEEAHQRDLKIQHLEDCLGCDDVEESDIKRAWRTGKWIVVMAVPVMLNHFLS